MRVLVVEDNEVVAGAVAEGLRDAEGVRLSVANSGQPIPVGQVAELFQPFRRLDSRPGTGTGSAARSETGSTASGAPSGTTGIGLGLSIVRSVVTAHGGNVCATARPDGGLAIEVALPSVKLPA